MRFVGQVLGENVKMEFGFEDVRKVDEDTIFVGEYAAVPVILSSVVIAGSESAGELKEVAGSLAIAFLQQTLDDGGTIEIPSLGIVIKN